MKFAAGCPGVLGALLFFVVDLSRLDLSDPANSLWGVLQIRTGIPIDLDAASAGVLIGWPVPPRQLDSKAAAGDRCGLDPGGTFGFGAVDVGLVFGRDRGQRIL